MNSNSYIPKKIYMPRGIGVKEYAFYDEMNSPNRQAMEDGRIKIRKKSETWRLSIFVVNIFRVFHL